MKIFIGVVAVGGALIVVLVLILIYFYKRLVAFRKSLFQFSGSHIPLLYTSTPIRSPSSSFPSSRLQESTLTHPTTPPPPPSHPTPDSVPQHDDQPTPESIEPTLQNDDETPQQQSPSTADTEPGSEYSVSRDDTSHVVTIAAEVHTNQWLSFLPWHARVVRNDYFWKTDWREKKFIFENVPFKTIFSFCTTLITRCA